MRIFLSYRRDDSDHQTGRIRDRLSREFGNDAIFMDVDGIPLGVNFAERINEEIGQSDVLVTIIGNRWLALSDDKGARRLDNPADAVRIEISSALKRNIPIIPILLDGAKVPSVDVLPEDIKELAYRNGLDVRFVSFHKDVDRLVRELKPFYDPWPKRLIKAFVVRQFFTCALAWVAGTLVSNTTFLACAVMRQSMDDTTLTIFLIALSSLSLIVSFTVRYFRAWFWQLASGVLSMWAAIPAGLVMINMNAHSYREWAVAWSVFLLVSGGIVSSLLVLAALLRAWWSSRSAVEN